MPWQRKFGLPIRPLSCGRSRSASRVASVSEQVAEVQVVGHLQQRQHVLSVGTYSALPLTPYRVGESSEAAGDLRPRGVAIRSRLGAAAMPPAHWRTGHREPVAGPRSALPQVCLPIDKHCPTKDARFTLAQLSGSRSPAYHHRSSSVAAPLCARDAKGEGLKAPSLLNARLACILPRR